MMAKLTVGELRKKLESCPPETQITFGSSKYSMRPLIFYRVKQRGENYLQIELNELDEKIHDPVAECTCREIVRDFLDKLKLWPDECEISFGATMDAAALEFTGFSNVLGINLDQPAEPTYKG